MNQRFWGETQKTGEGITKGTGLCVRAHACPGSRSGSGEHSGGGDTCGAPAALHSLGCVSYLTWQAADNSRLCLQRALESSEDPYRTNASFVAVCLKEQPAVGFAVLYVTA